MGPDRLALAVYRALLRWSRANADVPFSLRPGDVAVLAPSLRSLQPPGSLMRHADLGAAAIPALARAEMAACAGAVEDDAAAALDRGLEAVRVLHTTYQQQLSAMRETRLDRFNKQGVKWAVGQVFVHKKFGYRGVIYGWDRQCARDEAWMKAMNVQVRHRGCEPAWAAREPAQAAGITTLRSCSAPTTHGACSSCAGPLAAVLLLSAGRDRLRASVWRR